MNLLELANAYRTMRMASGILAHPHVIRKIVRESGRVATDEEHGGAPVTVAAAALALIQEGLRSVVRIPSGTAHALDSSGFPIAVMGKTGTTNDFKDALFIGSTYGPAGITVAVRIGFDDNHSLGLKETGGRVVLPVFKEILLKEYREKLLGPVPEFPAQMEQSINAHLKGDSLPGDDMERLGISAVAPFDPWPGRSSRSKGEWPQSFFLPRIADIPENAMFVPPGSHFHQPFTVVASH